MRTTARHLLRLAQRNAIALTALFVALAGSSYAAVTINGSNIRNNTINPSKLNPHLIAGNVRAWAIVRANGQVITGAGHPRVTPAAGFSGEYLIRWGVTVKRCATLGNRRHQLGPNRASCRSWELGARAACWLCACLDSGRSGSRNDSRDLQPKRPADAVGVQRRRHLLT